jgi:hypothetical protein
LTVSWAESRFGKKLKANNNKLKDPFFLVENISLCKLIVIKINA